MVVVSISGVVLAGGIGIEREITKEDPREGMVVRRVLRREKGGEGGDCAHAESFFSSPRCGERQTGKNHCSG
jgi:hypothetical protein